MEDLPEELRHNSCIYCKKELNDKDWNSEWGDSQHYKTIRCGCCGKKNWLRVDYAGSGHDNPLLEDQTLEAMVKKVQGK